MKLGLRPHAKTDDELLAIRWRGVTPPAYPPVVDHLTGVIPGLDGNDRYGDCGPTSCDNHRRITTLRELGTQRDAQLTEVFALYSASSSPPFNPATGANDNGVEMPDLLAALRKVGLAGAKIVAYGRLHDTSLPSVKAAISLFGAVLLAVDLQTAQQAQGTIWDYSQSPEWGGHAIVAGAYDTTGVDVFSWGTRIHATDAFLEHQLDEVWVPLWPEIVASNKFAANVDVATLAADFQQLTGATFPVAPAPVPADADAALWELVKDWVLNHRHSGEAKQVAGYLRQWAVGKGYGTPAS